MNDDVGSVKFKVLSLVVLLNELNKDACPLAEEVKLVPTGLAFSLDANILNLSLVCSGFTTILPGFVFGFDLSIDEVTVYGMLDPLNSLISALGSFNLYFWYIVLGS